MKLSSLPLWFSLLVFAVFVGGKYFIEIPAATRTVVAEETHYLDSYLSMRAVMIQSALLEKNYQVVRDWVASEAAFAETELLVIVDSKGMVVASSQIADEGMPIDSVHPEVAAATRVFDDTLRTVVQVSADRNKLSGISPMMTYSVWGTRDLYPAYIYLRRDLTQRREKMAAASLSQIAVAGATCLFISAIFVAVFRQIVRKRVDAINAVTDSYMAGNRFARVDLDGRDEIARIGRGINRMLEAINTQHEQITDLAYHDQQTQLLNRNGVAKVIESLLAEHDENGEHVWTFFLLSIDGMHDINVSFGFELGDQLIVRLADALREKDREFKIIAYIGNNRFLLVRPTSQLLRERVAQFHAFVERCAQRIGADAPVELPSLSISTGIYFSRLQEPLPRIVGSCELSLRQAKSQGINQIHVMEQVEQTNLVSRSRLLHELSAALDADDLYLVFQPKVALSTGKTSSAECLIRWTKADGTMIPPAEFVALAETGKLITKLDYWVIARACSYIRSWCESGKQMVPIAVNVSARTFYREDFIERVAAIIAEYGIDPHLLEIEITEYSAIKDVVTTVQHIEALEALGVVVAIDDFGMGNSNLDILLTLPIHHIKIDQSFIRASLSSRRGEQILSSLVNLARSLGLTITAEGVEQYDQVEYLKRLGCTQAQGYFFAKPLSEADFLHFLRTPPALSDGAASPR